MKYFCRFGYVTKSTTMYYNAKCRCIAKKNSLRALLQIPVYTVTEIVALMQK